MATVVEDLRAGDDALTLVTRAGDVGEQYEEWGVSLLTALDVLEYQRQRIEPSCDMLNS